MIKATRTLKKSESLTFEEQKRFKQLVEKFNTREDCASALTLSRQAIHRILGSGSGKPESIEKIRALL